MSLPTARITAEVLGIFAIAIAVVAAFDTALALVNARPRSRAATSRREMRPTQESRTD